MSRPLHLDSLPPVARLASVALGLARPSAAGDVWRFGVSRLDALALPLAALHEVFPDAEGDGPAAAAAVLLLALLAARQGPIVWVRDDAARRDGRLYGLGLAELGCNPDRLLLVEAPDVLGVLRAGHDAVACPAIGAVILAVTGTARALDLTVTRRFAHAAGRSGVPTLLLRQGEVRPTAAFSRWRVAAAPSQPLAAGAPGLPSFTFRLDRHRGGAPGFAINLEWDRDRSVLRTPLPGAAPALAARRTRRQERRVA
ncbi:hypothetical protein IP88_16325 [alpha proteobacterium AAP81b]|nr:hypothetical protein IP88_16325 [alpha proteobacterium AAP81b]